jgi:hypothetical protein
MGPFEEPDPPVVPFEGLALPFEQAARVTASKPDATVTSTELREIMLVELLSRDLMPLLSAPTGASGMSSQS